MNEKFQVEVHDTGIEDSKGRKDIHSESRGVISVELEHRSA